MKNRYHKTLPLIFLLAGLLGCTAANETVIDSVTGKAVAQQQETQASGTAGDASKAIGADGQPIQEVIVPQENPVVEDETTAASARAASAMTVAATTAKDGNTSVEAQAQSRQQAQKPNTQGFFSIHFEFDKYTVSEVERGLLAKNAALLESSPKTSVLIEGHADERGETEYNLALGDRRARSIQRFLQDLGIAPERLSTISYGEEKPAIDGHDEDAWAQNRRAEFKTTN